MSSDYKKKGCFEIVLKRSFICTQSQLCSFLFRCILASLLRVCPSISPLVCPSDMHSLNWLKSNIWPISTTRKWIEVNNDHNHHDDHNDHNNHNETTKKRRHICVCLPNLLFKKLQWYKSKNPFIIIFKFILTACSLPLCLSLFVSISLAPIFSSSVSFSQSMCRLHLYS